MKRSKVLGALLLLVLPMMAWAGVVSAQSFRSGDTATVPASEKVDGSVWAAGRTIDIAGEVNGDVFCAGQNIAISGKVTGDVICAGQTITISGVVEGDVRLAGQTVSIGGEVKHHATIAGQTFSLEGKGKIGGDASVGGNDTIVHGVVGRDLIAAATNIRLTGVVTRNLQAQTEQVHLESQAVVGGNLTYTSHNNVQLAEGARVAGTTTKHDRRPEPRREYGPAFSPSFGWALYMLLAMLIMALAVVLLFPGVVHETTNKALERPLKTFLTGLAAGFVVPILIVALMISVVGIPLGLLLLGIWLVLLTLAGPFSAYYIGREVFRNGRHPVLIMTTGTLILFVLYLVPVLNFLLWIVVAWMGTGMLLRELMRRTPKPQYELHHTPKRPRRKA